MTGACSLFAGAAVRSEALPYFLGFVLALSSVFLIRAVEILEPRVKGLLADLESRVKSS
jgi:hypothetical protein